MACCALIAQAVASPGSSTRLPPRPSRTTSSIFWSSASRSWLPKTRQLLQLSACPGRDFTVDLLQQTSSPRVQHRRPIRAAAALREAVAEGFLIPVAGAYRFVHDRFAGGVLHAERQRATRPAPADQPRLAGAGAKRSRGGRAQSGEAATPAQAEDSGPQADDRRLFALTNPQRSTRAPRCAKAPTALPPEPASGGRARCSRLVAATKLSLRVERLPAVPGRSTQTGDGAVPGPGRVRLPDWTLRRAKRRSFPFFTTAR